MTEDEALSALRGPDAEAAARAEAALWEMWCRSGRPDVDSLLRRGIQAMEREDLPLAQTIFSEVIALAPRFAEGWNKRATAHYMAGNFHARRRFAAFRQLLDFVGVDLNRLQFSWVAAAEGGKWLQVVSELTDRGRELGPMREFRELDAAEHWSAQLDGPELQEAYKAI